MSSRDLSSRKREEKTTGYGDYEEQNPTGKGRKRQSAAQRDTESNSPISESAYPQNIEWRSFVTHDGNFPQVSQLDWSPLSSVQSHQVGPSRQAEEAAYGSAMTTGRSLTTGHHDQSQEEDPHTGELRRADYKPVQKWSIDDCYLLTAIGAAQVTWRVKSRYFPGHSPGACSKKYWDEVERIRTQRKEAGEQSAFALGESKFLEWDLETKQAIEDMILRGASSQELMQYTKNQGKSLFFGTSQTGNSQIRTSDAGTSRAGETPDYEERLTKRQDSNQWSEREDIIIAKSHAKRLTWHETSKRVPGRTADACRLRWHKLPKRTRDRLTRLSED